MTTISFSVFNERGIGYLQNQQYREAAESFGHGLTLVKTAFANAAAPTSPLSSSSSSCCIGCSSVTLYKDEATVDQSRSSQSMNATVHHTPLFLDASLCRCGCSACQSKLAFVFIFNMALSYHLYALTPSSTKNSRILSKALSLYKMADKLRERGRVPVTPWECHALTKNLSHVVSVLEFQARSHNAVQILATSTTPNMDTREAEQVWNGFLSVLLNLCKFPDDKAAPAA